MVNNNKSQTLVDPDPGSGKKAWEPGKLLLGEYRVCQSLGEGGMGTVYLVESASAPGNFFAVKTLKAQALRNSKKQQGFLRELRTWIGLPEHPHLVACRFFRTVEDRIAIFADYVDGGSLKSWIRSGETESLSDILDYGIQTAWGLQAAHDCGVIHQDFKPGNVLLSSDGSAKLTDFGLSRAPQSTSQDSNSSSTSSNSLVTSRGMTLAYCSPEQGAMQRVNLKTDMWSWAVSLLEMFVGKVSWQIGTVAPIVLLEFLELHSGKDRPKMPDSIVEILGTCFEEDPEQRYESMRDITNQLIRIYSDVTGDSYPRTEEKIDPYINISHTKLNRFTRDGTLWLDPRELLNDICLKTGVDASQYMDKSSKSGTRKSQAILDIELYEKAIDLLKGAISINRLDLIDGLREIIKAKAMTLQTLGDIPGALRLYTESIRYYEGLIENQKMVWLELELLLFYNDKASLHKDLGHEEEAYKFNDIALKICEKTVSESPNRIAKRHLALTILNRGVIANIFANVQEAEKYFSRSLKLYMEIDSDKEDPVFKSELAAAHLDLGIIFNCTGRTDKGIAHINSAIEILENLVHVKLQENYKGELALAYTALATGFGWLEQFKDAKPIILKAKEIQEELFLNQKIESFGWDLSQTYINLCLILENLEEYDEAIKVYHFSIELFENEVYRKGRTDWIHYLASNYSNFAFVLSKTGDKEKSELFQTKSIQILEKLVFKENRQEHIKRLIRVYFDMFEILLDQDEFESAENLTAEILSKFELYVQKIQKTVPDIISGQLQVWKSVAKLNQGNLEEAMSLKESGETRLKEFMKKTGDTSLTWLLDWTNDHFNTHTDIET